MLIKRKPKPIPIVGSIRKVKKFLILPRVTDTTIAWLDMYTLTYELQELVRFTSRNAEPWITWTLVNIEK